MTANSIRRRGESMATGTLSSVKVRCSSEQHIQGQQVHFTGPTCPPIEGTEQPRGGKSCVIEVKIPGENHKMFGQTDKRQCLGDPGQASGKSDQRW